MIEMIIEPLVYSLRRAVSWRDQPIRRRPVYNPPGIWVARPEERRTKNEERRTKNEERGTRYEGRVMRQLHCSDHAYLGYNVGLTFSETNRNSR